MPEIQSPMEIAAPHVPTDVLRRSWPLRLWPYVCGLAAAVVVFLLSRPAGLVEDDILNLQLHRGVESLGDLLLAPVFLTQVAPGHHALTALQLAIGPTDRLVMHALMAAVAGACVPVAAAVVTRLGRPSWWVPATLALVMAGPASLPAALWYAAAYHFYPALLAGLCGVLLYLRWRGTSSDLPRGAPLLSVLAVGVGLLFSLKAGAAVVLMLLLEYVLLRRGDLETVVLGLWKDRSVWWSYGLLLALYLAVTQRSGLAPEVGEVSTIAVALLRGLVQMSAPMLVGVGATEPNYTVPDVPAPLAIGAWVAVAILALLVVRHGAAARRGLVVGGAVLVISLTLSTGPRTTFLGELAALAPRYHLDGLTYLVIAVAAGLHLDGLGGTTDRPRWRTVVLRGIAVAALLGVAGATAWSHGTRLASSAAIASGAWTADLERSLAEHESTPRVLEAPMPPFLLSLIPGSRMSWLDGLVVGLDVSLTDPDSVVTADGNIEPLRTEVLFDQEGAQFADNPLVDVSGEFAAFGTNVCTVTEMRFAVGLAPHPAPRVLALRTDGEMTVDVGYPPRDLLRPEPGVTAPVEDGRGELVLPMDLLGRAQAIEVTVRAAEDTTACIERIRFLEVDNDLPGEVEDVE